jgi:hypothetical protein
MAMNPLPPQAYTREILQKAYQWLLTQNSSIKEMASNQDILVSLYLKAQRSGEASLEAPSIQNFKQELKSLASMIGDFQGESQTQAHLQSQAQSHVQNKTNIQYTETKTVTATQESSSQNLISQLDPQSILCIQEVKAFLNLGSDVDALRSLISLGHKQFQKIK